MAVSLEDCLVIGISSRALFDLDDENYIYETKGLQAYSEYQLAHEQEILKPGSGFALVKALLKLNESSTGAAAVDPALYATAEEKALIKTLSQLPEVIRLAARDYDPSGVNRYLVTLAGEFHRFYNACRIKGEEAAVLAARLKLADTVRAVIANCLSLIGVAAPEKM